MILQSCCLCNMISTNRVEKILTLLRVLSGSVINVGFARKGTTDHESTLLKNGSPLKGFRFSNCNGETCGWTGIYKHLRLDRIES